MWGEVDTVQAPADPSQVVAADTIRDHQPRHVTATGPIAGCMCGGLQLGESWSWHVTAALSRAGVLA